MLKLYSKRPVWERVNKENFLQKKLLRRSAIKRPSFFPHTLAPLSSCNPKIRKV